MSLLDPSTGMICPERGGWEESGKDGFHPWQQLLRRSPFFSLPTTERSWINAQATGQLLLAETHGAATSDDAFAKSPGLSIIGDVTQEGDDFGDEA